MVGKSRNGPLEPFFLNFLEVDYRLLPLVSSLSLPLDAVLDRPLLQVYEIGMLKRLLAFYVLIQIAIPASQVISAELPITKNLAIPEYQNNQQEVKPYDFNAPPQGMFLSITMAEGFEEEVGFRRTHEIVPVKPTEQFMPDASGIFIVFQLHQHYQGFKIFGLCFPEAVPGLDTQAPVSQDAMYISLEDESGYLRLLPPEGGWKPGKYKVEIHAGEQVNEVTLMGTMRFTVLASTR